VALAQDLGSNYSLDALGERHGLAKMMQARANYLDGLRAGAEVIPLFKRS
jgi:hypothetical protein